MGDLDSLNRRDAIPVCGDVSLRRKNVRPDLARVALTSACLSCYVVGVMTDDAASCLNLRQDDLCADGR